MNDISNILQPDFAVLDAYFDMWQQLAGGEMISQGFVERLLVMPHYLPSLSRYEEKIGVSERDLANVLLRLPEGEPGLTGPLADFRRANQGAINNLGHVFDIVFPLRRLRLTRALHEVSGAGHEVPQYVRIMPDLLHSPYMVKDALVIDFFALSLDEKGHIIAGGVTLDKFIVSELRKLL